MGRALKTSDLKQQQADRPCSQESDTIGQANLGLLDPVDDAAQRFDEGTGLYDSDPMSKTTFSGAVSYSAIPWSA